MKPAARPQRGQRVADQIQRDLAQMIQRELPSSRAGLITLTGVDLTPDYAHAKVYFTVLGKDVASTTQVLNDKAGYFHSVLFKQLSIHTVPRLVFVHDASVERGFEIDRLIAAAVATSVSAVAIKDLADEVADGAVDRADDAAEGDRTDQADHADDGADGGRASAGDGAPAADAKPAPRALRKRKA